MSKLAHAGDISTVSPARAADFAFVTASSKEPALTISKQVDTFVFVKGGGMDVVTDFTAGGTDDKLDLSQTARHFQDLADVLAHAHQHGHDTIIKLGHHDAVILKNVDKAALTSDDFIL